MPSVVSNWQYKGFWFFFVHPSAVFAEAQATVDITA
jgi:hypothetical protein